MSTYQGVKYSFFIDRFIVVVAYAIALLAGWFGANYYNDQELWVQIAVGDFIATVIIFLFSLFLRNSSMYDPYWSVLPIFILFYVIGVAEQLVFTPRVIMLLVVVLYWGIRLTRNWLKTWPGLDHEDWRYIKLAEDTKAFYWPVSFLGIHLFPTILVYLGCLPFIPIVNTSAPLIWTDVLGFLIAFFAVEIERRADDQLRAFKESQTTKSVCDVGLWKYSRHPNYFGEISFWGGVFIMCLGLNPTQYLNYGIGFLSMVILFVFITIPMMEKRQMGKEGYAAYRKQVWMLIPWFRKNGQ